MGPYAFGAHMLVGPQGKCPLGPCVKTALKQLWTTCKPDETLQWNILGNLTARDILKVTCHSLYYASYGALNEREKVCCVSNGLILRPIVHLSSTLLLGCWALFSPNIREECLLHTIKMTVWCDQHIYLCVNLV